MWISQEYHAQSLLDLSRYRTLCTNHVEEIRTTNKTVIRLSNFLKDYNTMGRYRIKSLKVAFLDKDKNYLPRNTTILRTKVAVTFPNSFSDKDIDGKTHKFYARPPHHKSRSRCISSYYRENEAVLCKYIHNKQDQRTLWSVRARKLTQTKENTFANC